MGKSILVFDDLIDGHHLEYIHHLYEIACGEPNMTFVFSVPRSILMVWDKFQWPGASNILWDYIDDDNISNKKENRLLHSFRLSMILRDKAKQYSVSDVFIISLMGYLPILPFLFLFSKVRISGIVYMIYLFRWKKASLFMKIQDVMKYILLSKFHTFNDVFILNSHSASKYLCRIYNSSRFRYLPDPFMPLCKPEMRVPSLKKEKKVFLHFGSMTERKGTIEILRAISLIAEEELTDIQFVFAGKIQDDIKYIFYQLYDQLKSKVDLVVCDRFCTFEEIAFLCSQSQCIIIPYKETAQSSGVIGYAAQFSKPVIAPSQGLIGKLVKHYRLGILINEINPNEIYNALFHELPLFNICSMHADKYISDNSVGAFKQIIANGWTDSL